MFPLPHLKKLKVLYRHTYSWAMTCLQFKFFSTIQTSDNLWKEYIYFCTEGVTFIYKAHRQKAVYQCTVRSWWCIRCPIKQVLVKYDLLIRHRLWNIPNTQYTHFIIHFLYNPTINWWHNTGTSCSKNIQGEIPNSMKNEQVTQL